MFLQNRKTNQNLYIKITQNNIKRGKIMKKRYSSVEFIILLWLICNIIAMPLSYAQFNEIDTFSTTTSKEFTNLGLWQKITPINTIKETVETYSTNEKTILFSAKEDNRQQIKKQDPLLISIIILTIILTLISAFIFQDKKGQITIFIIIGAVLITSISIITYMNTRTVEQRYKEDVTKITSSESFKNFVESCISETSIPIVRQLGIKGGKFNLTDQNSRWHNGVRYRYLCNFLEGSKGCVAKVFLRNHMSNEIATKLKQKLPLCINLTAFKQKSKYNITEGEMDFEIDISNDDLNVKLFYPVTLTKERERIEVDKYSTKIDLPLGKAYVMANTIINNLNIKGYFDKDEWMFNHDVEFLIKSNKPYPDTTYSLIHINKQRNETYTFNFAVESIDTISRIGSKKLRTFAHGCCLNKKDGTCLKNADEAKCRDENFTYYDSSQSCTCPLPPIETDQPRMCNGEVCKDCNNTYSYSDRANTGPKRKHGESWCAYDTQILSGVGVAGFSYVGSRHYKHSCIDGREVLEPCRDFREELCTQRDITRNDENYTKAVCRLNRWDECFKCKTKECCEDTTYRDCYWWDTLTTDNKCYPTIPPGFKFWDGNGAEVCNTGTLYKECVGGFGCKKIWVDHTALFCYFQGDCGNSRNIADKRGRDGFFNTDPIDTVRSYVYLPQSYNYNPAEIGERILTIPLDTREQIELSGDQFKSPIATLPILVTVGMNYLKYLMSLDISDFINPFGGGRPEIKVLDYALCNVWNPPLGGNDCWLCEAEKPKPCSEYRCKSLGQLCAYEEINGTGRCYAVSTDDTQGPVIAFDNSTLSENFTAVPSKITARLKEIDGVEIQPALKSYEPISFGINASEPVRCKLNYFPNMSYNFLPSIWFGDPTFKQNHNISLRFPKGLEVPSKVLDSLNISSITDLVNIMKNLDAMYAKYKKKFKTELQLYKTFSGVDIIDIIDPFVKLASAFIKAILAKYPYLEDITKIILAEFEQGGMYLFILCTDQAGNQNDDFFIKIRLNKTEIDDDPPKIEEARPLNNTKIAKSKDNFTLKIYTNEPSECWWDTADKKYHRMKNKLDCPSSNFDISFVGGGTYECTDEVNFTNMSNITIYVRCLDNPPQVDHYYFTMTRGNNFSLIGKNNSRYLNMTGNNLLATSHTLNKQTNVSFTGSIYLKMYLDELRECRLSVDENKTDFLNMTVQFPPPITSPYIDLGVYEYGSDVPTATITKNTTVTIACREINITKRNYNIKSYVLNINRSNPLKQIGVFPQTGEITDPNPMLVISLENSIDEFNILCNYASDPKFGYIPMEEFGEFQYRAQLNNLKEGEWNFTIQCTDKYKNFLETNTTFTVVV